MQLSGKGTSGKFETDYLNDCFWPRLCENTMTGIIRKSPHRAKPNEAFH